MRINNNIMAMNTHRQYGINNTNVAKSVEKLSSGYRINRAGDDAAGLAISEKMRAQIRGLTMASKNSQDAISLVQTAEGALQETHNILQRMRELAVQSASDTNETTIDRDALNKEFQALIAEIDDTAAKTKFNDMGLIDGSFSKYSMAKSTVTGFENSSAVDGVTAAAFDKIKFFAEALASKVTESAPNTPVDPAFGFTISTTGLVTVSATETYQLVEGQTKLQFANGISIEFGEGIKFNATTGVISNADKAIDGNLAATLAATQTVAATFDAQMGKEFVVQTGANKGDELKINIDYMDSKAVGVFGSNVATREYASNAIKETNDAINKVSTQRAALGALQNRMEHKIANLDTSAENLQAAEARIRDLDMAKEMTTFTRNNILSQAATAMLAQANSLPQGVLQLLR